MYNKKAAGNFQLLFIKSGLNNLFVYRTSSKNPLFSILELSFRIPFSL